MSYAAKGVWVSFAIHAALFAVIITLGGIVAPTKRAIIIDFNVMSSIEMPKDDSKEIPAKTRQIIKKTRTDIKEKEKKIDKTEAVSDAHDEHITEPLSSTNMVRPQGETLVSKGGERIATSPKTDGLSESKKGSSDKSVNTEIIGKAKYLKEHFLYIRDLIMKNIAYPRIARKMGWEGKVVISFVIKEDGSVDNIRVVESCGNNVLDKDAIETVKRAVPFPKPPVRAEIVIPVVYRLT